ncbi:MAG: serine/threonine-protein kinase [Candidatus Aminicenantales bacterium]
MKCPSCRADNQPDSRFCHYCATPLPSDIAESAPSPSTKTMVTPFMDLSRGTLFAGRYEVIEEIGKGGMGKVYKVYDQKIKEIVALKLIKPEIGFNEKAVERFKNELKFARKISHRHVCRLYDLGEIGMSHFITMEYVEGEDLKNFIRRAGHITTPKAISIAQQICEGLVEAHRQGVVHRDLKPQNVMIDREGNVRVMDFGLARFTEVDGVTGSGVMLGTPEYMSPEQVEIKDIDARSDIYSLGVIMHEMVTGKAPFSGETPLSIAIKHKSEKPRDSREINPLVPEALSRLILKCMEKNPDKRYQSADELLQDLIRVEQGLPTAIKEITKSEPLGSREITVKFQLKKIILPLILITFCLIVLGGLFKKTKNDQRSGGNPALLQKPPNDSYSPGLSSIKDVPSPSRPDAPPQGGGGSSPNILNRIGGEISKYLASMDGQDVKDLEKFTSTLKGILPEKGPYADAYKNIEDKINESKKKTAAEKPAGAAPAGPAVQNDMKKLLSLVSERQAALTAKETMTAAKMKAQRKTDMDKNLIFRLARYEETNADDAFAKNDFSGATTLYRVLEKIYDLAPLAANDKDGVDKLRQFVAGLIKGRDQEGPSGTDPWLLEYARETETQAQVFSDKNDWENAGGAYIRAAFLYQKLIETASQK